MILCPDKEIIRIVQVGRKRKLEINTSLLKSFEVDFYKIVTVTRAWITGKIYYFHPGLK